MMDNSKLGKNDENVHPRTNEEYTIRQSQLELEEIIGSGEYCVVHKGFCTLRKEGRVPVAIRKMKVNDVSTEEELFEVADIMRNLFHQRIIHLIGLCAAECMTFVLELCPCGPLNLFLRNHK
ncbi:tyrosine-protein kinase SYK-like [Mytilus trossulus]|uniref:tyrosine-protein kinase SYK-like n=1 Tax=Mytilus trossulus TaxID=6551 RepID=UPI003004A7EB